MSGNQEQIEFWNGPRAEQWVAGQEVLDRQLAPFGEAALSAARLALGEHVVDVGCGCGDTTLAIARAVGDTGDVLGVDISEPMLARAHLRAQDRPNVRFRHADASSFSFEARYDCLFSRFGVMFFAEPTVAFVNLRRALVPGGRLAFACWRAIEENDWMRIPLAAASTVITPARPPPPPDAPGPFAFADPNRVRAILESAGFREIVFSPFERIVPVGQGGGLDAATEEAVNVGPASRLFSQADPALRGPAQAAIRAALARFLVNGEVRLKANAWVVTGRSPE